MNEQMQAKVFDFFYDLNMGLGVIWKRQTKISFKLQVK